MVVDHFQTVYTTDMSVGHALDLFLNANFYFNADQLCVLMSIPQDAKIFSALSSMKPF